MTIRKYQLIQPHLVFTLVALLVATTFIEQADAASKKDNFLEKSSKAFVEVVKDAKPAVVHIRVEQTRKVSNSSNRYNDEFFNHPFFEQFFGQQFKQQRPQKERKAKSQGSGFIISEDGYILTNNHVVDNADLIKVKLSDDREFEAELVGADPQSDVALLKVDSSSSLPTIPLGDSDDLEVAEWVIAIGNPFGLTQTVTVGVVSAKGRSRVGINDYENFIQTDAAINPGNSGGPLLNSKGEVVGINTALYTRTGGYMGIGFAIPINMAKYVEDQLQSDGRVTRGWLGVVIQNMDKNLAKSFGLDEAKGILIGDVQEDSPAEKGGIKQGDVIIAINKKQLKNVADMRNKVAMIKPGTKVPVDLIRKGKEKRVWVTIQKQPEDFGSSAKDSKTRSFDNLGLVMQNLTPELSEKFGFSNRQGVLISDVKQGSPAAEAGLRAGYLIEEVNKTRVKNIKEMRAVLKKAGKNQHTLLRVNTGKSSQYVVLVSK